MFSILIVSLHSKAGLTGARDQYWKSKALVLSVYRSVPSSGLGFISNVLISVCRPEKPLSPRPPRPPFVRRQGAACVQTREKSKTNPADFHDAGLSAFVGSSLSSSLEASGEAPLSITSRYCSPHQDVELWRRTQPSEAECNVNYSVG